MKVLVLSGPNHGFEKSAPLIHQFLDTADDLDVELICRILLFPIGLPRLLQLPSITDYVAFEHRHHLSVIPARVSIVCL